MSGEDREWQRLDKWLWCARFMKARAGCARWIAEGGVRINRQPTDKPHARLRPGDVLTLPMQKGAVQHEVRVVRVVALAARRGPAPEARALYEELADPVAGTPSLEVLALEVQVGPCGAVACVGDESQA